MYHMSSSCIGLCLNSCYLGFSGSAGILSLSFLLEEALVIVGAFSHWMLWFILITCTAMPLFVSPLHTARLCSCTRSFNFHDSLSYEHQSCVTNAVRLKTKNHEGLKRMKSRMWYTASPVNVEPLIYCRRNRTYPHTRVQEHKQACV